MERQFVSLATAATIARNLELAHNDGTLTAEQLGAAVRTVTDPRSQDPVSIGAEWLARYPETFERHAIDAGEFILAHREIPEFARALLANRQLLSMIAADRREETIRDTYVRFGAESAAWQNVARELGVPDTAINQMVAIRFREILRDAAATSPERTIRALDDAGVALSPEQCIHLRSRGTAATVPGCQTIEDSVRHLTVTKRLYILVNLLPMRYDNPLLIRFALETADAMDEKKHGIAREALCALVLPKNSAPPEIFDCYRAALELEAPPAWLRRLIKYRLTHTGYVVDQARPHQHNGRSGFAVSYPGKLFVHDLRDQSFRPQSDTEVYFRPSDGTVIGQSYDLNRTRPVVCVRFVPFWPEQS